MTMGANSQEKKKQKLDTQVGFEDLCPELVEKILSHIPLKPRTRLKCVSKTWCDLITYIRHSSSFKSSLSIVYDRRRQDRMGEASFITFEDQGGVTWGQTSLSLGHTFHGGCLLDSCNGLLLYLAIDKEHVTKDGEGCTKFVVSNPVLNQCLEIPFHQRWHCFIFAALVFDGSQKHFKVIHYSTYRFNHSCKVIKCYIFSSETMEWKEHEARVLNSSFSCVIGTCSYASLYWKGKLYSIWGESMLVYNVEKGFFTLVSLPRIGQWPWNEVLLWEFEGQLQYCQSGFRGFHIWTYKDLNCKWVLKQSVTDDELKLRNCMLFLDDEEKIRFQKSLYYIHVVAFDDDLQVVYLKISDDIFSYSLETRQLAKVMCSDPSSFDLRKFDNYRLIFKAYQFRQLSSFTYQPRVRRHGFSFALNVSVNIL